MFFDRRHFSKTLVSVHQSKGGSTDTFQLNWFTKATGRCNQSFWNFRAIGRPVASLSLRPVNLEAWGHIMSCKQVGVTFFITSLTDSIFFQSRISAKCNGFVPWGWNFLILLSHDFYSGFMRTWWFRVLFGPQKDS